jgi:hypothetical protein
MFIGFHNTRFVLLLILSGIYRETFGQTSYHSRIDSLTQGPLNKPANNFIKKSLLHLRQGSFNQPILSFTNLDCLDSDLDYF